MNFYKIIIEAIIAALPGLIGSVFLDISFEYQIIFLLVGIVLACLIHIFFKTKNVTELLADNTDKSNKITENEELITNLQSQNANLESTNNDLQEKINRLTQIESEHEDIKFELNRIKSINQSYRILNQRANTFITIDCQQLLIDYKNVVTQFKIMARSEKFKNLNEELEDLKKKFDKKITNESRDFNARLSEIQSSEDNR